MKTRNHFDGDIIEQVNKELNFILEHILLSAWLVPGKVQREEELADMVDKELIVERREELEKSVWRW